MLDVVVFTVVLGVETKRKEKENPVCLSFKEPICMATFFLTQFTEVLLNLLILHLFKPSLENRTPTSQVKEHFCLTVAVNWLFLLVAAPHKLYFTVVLQYSSVVDFLGNRSKGVYYCAKILRHCYKNVFIIFYWGFQW